MLRLTLALVAAALLAAAVASPSTGSEAVLPPGTSVGGVDVGSLPLAQAAARLEAELGDRLALPIRVRAAGHRRRLTMREARLDLDPLRSAQRAYDAAVEAGGPVAVPPVVSYDERRVRRFVGRINRTVRRPARDAELRYSVTRLKVRGARKGYRIRKWRLLRRVERALADPRAPRILRARRRGIRPDITRRDIVRRHETVVTIHRRGFRLRLFKGLEQVASYPVAVGMPGHATPRGRFHVANKAVDPAWSAPDQPWAGAYRDEVVPGGSPQNPLKARWMGIVDGVGIHGTAATWSLGSRASHGCIRMSVPDVKALYERVPVGTLVMIK